MTLNIPNSTTPKIRYGTYSKRSRITRLEVEDRLNKKKKHLAAYLDAYKRLLGLLFDMFDKVSDYDVHIYNTRYLPNQRVFKVGVCWVVDGVRSYGYIALWRGGIFDQSDIVYWPATKCLVENWTPIAEDTDANICDAVLTALGAPWASRFTAIEEVGEMQFETKKLLRAIRRISDIASDRHAFTVEDIMHRINMLAKESGVADFG